MGLAGCGLIHGGGGTCSGSEAGSFSRLKKIVYHSSLGLSVTKKKKELRVLLTSRLESYKEEGRGRT